MTAAQPTLWDAQAVNLQRVGGRIGPVVEDFCRERLGMTFHVADLQSYVLGRALVAPASPDRILRDLRSRGLIAYEVVNRSQSLYRLTRVGNDVANDEGPADRSNALPVQLTRRGGDVYRG